MVKLYFLALAAVVLVLAPSDVSAISNFHYKCNGGNILVSFTPSLDHSGTVTVVGTSNSACTVAFKVNEPFQHTFNAKQCGGPAMKLKVMESQLIVHGGSTSSSSSSSTQTVNC
ncbi:GSCOCG00005212001-RA-CDS [Cotesia congregata]|uniref:Uncharacterized protein n=1 Tax=Cotesia congregata TaxID=51543 RepID=A0A8J2MQY9_COTCN|nr:GSCOCG00005212001-RA-CDS [Cotesia congregata]CAG5101886.1 Protein of unknown function [Cotesia congregata]